MAPQMPINLGTNEARFTVMHICLTYAMGDPPNARARGRVEHALSPPIDPRQSPPYTNHRHRFAA